MSFAGLSSATGIPAAVLEAIAKIESNGNVRSLRFERRLFQNRGGSLEGLPSGTGHATVRAAIARSPRAAVESTSWGRFQVLGGRGLALYGQPDAFVRAFEAGPGVVGDRMVVRWFQENPRAAAAARAGDLEELGRRYNGSERWAVRLRAELSRIQGGERGAAKLAIGEALAAGVVLASAGATMPVALGVAAIAASRRRSSR